MKTSYSEYTVRVSTDAGYYGPNCTDADGRRIANQIADLIRVEFPGIVVDVTNDAGISKTTGPDSSTVDEINDWIAENWTAAL